MYKLVVLLCLVQICAGSRVLVVFPVPCQSHTILGDAIVQTLLNAEHEVTYVRPFSSVEPRTGLTSIEISSVGDKLTERDSLSLMEMVRTPHPPQQVLEIGTNYAQRALQHQTVKELLEDPGIKFDMVLAEWFYSGLLAPLAAVYDCPLIWYSAMDANWMSLQLVHAPTNPAYSADPQARWAARGHSIRDRLDRLRDQIYMAAWVYYMTYFEESSAYLEIYRTPLQLRARYPPNYEDLIHKASIMLVNSNPLLGQTMALPANTKYVGGHHIGVPVKPLSKKLQQILDESKNGVIFFSLGTNVKSEDLPEYMKRQLLDVFGQLEQTVIWEFEEHLEDLPSNVHIIEQVPHTSILNHTNTFLFITQGDFLSYMEAMYFGVPIIGIPIFKDQFLNIDLAETRGYGIRVGFTDYLPHRIKDAVNEILANYSYRSKAKKASVIFRNPQVSPQNELLYWIELTVNRGTDHLRSPALQLSTIERLHLDVIALIFMFAWFLSKVWKVIRVHFNWNPEDVSEADKKDQ